VLFTAGRDSSIRLWNVKDEVLSYTHTHTALSFFFFLCHLTSLSFFFGLFLQQPQFLKSLEHHTDWVNDVVIFGEDKRNSICPRSYFPPLRLFFSPLVLSCSSDTTVKLWNRKDGVCLETLGKHADYAKALAISEKARLLASVGLDGNAYLWDVPSAKAVALCTIHSQKKQKTISFYCTAMNDDGTLLGVGASDGAIRFWDTKSVSKIFSFKEHKENVRSLLIDKQSLQVRREKKKKKTRAILMEIFFV
jgi:WD40 repeat protein